MNLLKCIMTSPCDVPASFYIRGKPHFSRAPSKLEQWKAVPRNSLTPRPKASWKPPFSMRICLGKNRFHAVSWRYPDKTLQSQHGLGVKLQTHRKTETSVLSQQFNKGWWFQQLAASDYFTCSPSLSFSLEKKKKTTQPTPPSLCYNCFI